MRRPVDLVLHVGATKTGSTSIQEFLAHNRAPLAAHGTLYPETFGDLRRIRLSLYVTPDDALPNRLWLRSGLGDTDPAEFRSSIRERLLGEIETSGCERLLLSDETLFGGPAATVAEVRRFTDDVADSVRVVVYLRRQDDHLVSMYQQAVRGGAVQRLAEWSQRPRHRIYDYHRRLAMWRRHVTPDGMVVRLFEPEAFSGGSLVADYFEAAGIPTPVEGLEPVAVQNERLGAEATEFLRLLNLLRHQNPELDGQELANRRFLPQLAELPGPALTLPEAELDEFMEQWAESNRATAREFLGRDELFRAPRKSSGTTATQALDPRRLDRLVELLGVPESARDGLRRVAAREADR